MNDETLMIILKIVTDETLDKIIDVMMTGHRNQNTEFGMQLATLEWRARYPNTIAPSIFKRAEKKGGFPECYSGPRETINLQTGVRISIQRVH